MVTYPRLLRRIQAVMIDSIIIPVVLWGVIFLISKLNVDSIHIKIMAVVLPVFILEPAMVAFTGGTIGHHILRIKVRNVNQDKNINIIFACFRFIVKLILGLFSLIFVLTTKKHQAIHDILFRTIVVNKNPVDLPKNEALSERSVESSDYFYPSKTRRILVVLVYNIVIIFLLAVSVELFMSLNCIEYNHCNKTDKFLSVILNLLWILGFILTIVYGWKAKLYGCRRKPKGID